MAQILYPDGTQKDYSPKNGTSFTLKELQEIVGGYIEIIPTKTEDVVMVLNEEGKFTSMERNEQATALIHFMTPAEQRLVASQPHVIFVGDPSEEDYIVGTVLVCQDKEVR